MPNALETWYAVVKSKDHARLETLLADDAVFHSPVIFKPQVGKGLTLSYLRAALKVLDNGSFRYVGEWTSANSAVLEFVTELDGIAVDGADFITWNAAGQIIEFKVMIRPLKAINIVMQKMGEELAKAEG